MKRGGARQTVRLCAAAATLAWAVPAGAQRLAYADLGADPAGAPRLGYDVAADEGLAAPETAGSRPEVAATARAGGVREFYLDQMEIALARGDEGYAWDVSARIGGPRHRLHLGSIGEGVVGGSLDYLEMQAFYSRRIGEGWDLQAGLRYDLRPVPNRAWAALGAQGSVGDNLYLGLYGFLSHRGELAARVYAVYDVPLGGGFVLQPSAEANFFGQDIEALGLGRGLSYGEVGVRLRYVVRDDWLAPYVGVEYAGSFGRTARFAREAGEEPSGAVLLIGLRSWF